MAEYSQALREEAENICLEGCRLRRTLETSSLQLTTIGDLTKDTAILFTVFNASTSIYLSGIFDYEIHHWQQHQLSPPTLGEEQIQWHTNTILRMVTCALNNAESRLSSLLWLFPLRIAGARSRHPWQRETVLAMLSRVGQDFVAANAMAEGLRAFWNYWDRAQS